MLFVNLFIYLQVVLISAALLGESQTSSETFRPLLLLSLLTVQLQLFMSISQKS